MISKEMIALRVQKVVWPFVQIRPNKYRSPGKSLDAKAPGWGQIFGANPGVCGGIVMAKVNSCFILAVPRKTFLVQCSKIFKVI